jgi:hypothetical protein
MGRIGLLGALAVLLLPFGGAVSRPLPLTALPPATAPLTGLVYETGAYRLAQVDPVTLGVARTSEPLAQGYGWARSPDGGMLVLGTGVKGSYETTALQFADPATLELVGKPVTFPGIVRVALWPAPRNVFAVVESLGKSTLQIVDALTRRVVAVRALGGPVLSYARFDRGLGLVLLLGVDGKLAPARFAVVHPDGLVRTTRLERIRAGALWNWNARDGIGQVREPGLAVDDVGHVAYVVDPGWLVAAVDLGTLRVGYHRPLRALVSRIASWLTPAAEAKGLNGPVRTARWLGDGLVAVWGSNQTAVRKKGGTVYSGTPAGVSVLDTRAWSVQTIDPEGNSATIGDGIMLTTGGRWSSTGSTSRGIADFGPDGALRWLLGERSNNWIASVYGSLVVLGKQGNLYDVLDSQSGKVLRSDVATPFPTLLLGQGS